MITRGPSPSRQLERLCVWINFTWEIVSLLVSSCASAGIDREWSLDCTVPSS